MRPAIVSLLILGSAGAAGSRLYVVDSYNYRVQYFRDTTSGVTPASLGKVKAVFR